MAPRHSRYREPAVALTADARGRTPATTPLRTRSPLAGSFPHVVAQGERLDQIAYRYYGEPTVWWRICDANPQFLSPLALLGQEPIRAVRFPLREDGPTTEPDWMTVKRVLAGIVGVEDVEVREEVDYVTVVREVGGAPHGPTPTRVVEERFRRAVTVRYNRTATSPEALRAAITSTGLSVDGPVDTGQLGRHIVIPPLGAV